MTKSLTTALLESGKPSDKHDDNGNTDNKKKNNIKKSKNVPRVLTRSVIPTLPVTALDAGDVLECYHLTRTAILEGTSAVHITKSALGLRYRRPANEMIYTTTTSTSSTVSSSSPVEVYPLEPLHPRHPQPQPQKEQLLKQRLELTIEFGPARVGEDLALESIPRIVVGDAMEEEEDENDDSSSGAYNPSKNTSSNSSNHDPRVVWDNVGRVYYTERIDSDTYTTANYLASLSGTVLTKLLQSAMDFVDYGENRESYSSPSSKRIHSNKPMRRYQPFAVYLIEQQQQPGDNATTSTPETNAEQSTPPPPQLLLKSSNDDDFLQHLFATLAELGVALQPVILPTSYQVQLHTATALEKVKVVSSSSGPKRRTKGSRETASRSSGTSSGSSTSLQRPSHVLSRVSSREPLLFFQKLSNCIQAIATANYSAYNDTIHSTTTTTTTTQINAHANSSTTSLSSAAPPTRRLRQQQQRPSAQKLGPSVNTTNTSRQSNMSSSAATVQSTKNSSHPTLSPSTTSPLNSTTDNPTTSPVAVVVPEDDSMASHQEQAATAAQNAQQAAEAAGAADTETEAVSAAQQAAVYAHKAATVTAQQAASVARDAILSGVGASVAQAVALCFSDPVYDLISGSSTIPSMGNNISNNVVVNASAASNTSIAATTGSNGVYNKRSVTSAYLYWDGTFYYRVNLTAPYVSVVSTVQPMPQPPVLGLGREDFVDWAIALVLVACAGVGFLLLLQQVMGRNLKVIRPLYRYQRWFFAPTHFAWKDVAAYVGDDSESIISRTGQQYTFGEDVIPLSMGGRRPQNDNKWLRGNSFNSNSFDDEIYDNDDDEHNITTDPILGDMEMMEQSSRSNTPLSTTAGPSTAAMMLQSRRSYGKGASFLSEASLEDDMDRSGAPVRLFRDPSLVDLPDCTYLRCLSIM